MPQIQPCPRHDIAASDGFAFRANDLVGASSYSPLALAAAPVWVEAGNAIPGGCDCVLDCDSVDQSGPLAQVLAEAIPGQGVRRAGTDIAAGSFVAEPGRRVLARDLMIARAAGIENLRVRRPRLRIVNILGGTGTADLIAESARDAGRARRSICRWRARLPPPSASPRSCCWRASRASGSRWRWGNCRSMRSPAPTRGSRCPGMRKDLLRACRSMPILCRGSEMDFAMTKTPLQKNHDHVDQDQFLTILTREDALARFEAALFPRPVPSEQRSLGYALGCALAEDIFAPIDVPPFDRAHADGFAVRSADLASAGEAAPVRMMLNDEIIACGTAPMRPVLSGTPTSIATGGPVPRGADRLRRAEPTEPA